MRLLRGSSLCSLVMVGCAAPDPPPNQSAEAYRLLNDERYEWVTIETPHTRIHFPVGSYAQENRSGLQERAAESLNTVLQRLHESEYANTVELFYVDSRQDMENLIGSPVNFRNVRSHCRPRVGCHPSRGLRDLSTV